MSFDWKEYLALAQDLRGSSGSGYSSEASDRSAVSRAYYAAFCFVRNYSRSYLGFQGDGSARDHKKLREHLKRSGRVKQASNLNKLRMWRNNCDYDDEVPNLQQYVVNAIQIAEAIIQELEQTTGK